MPSDTIELESTLLVADDPEAKHVDAPGLHLLHVLLKLGGERNSQKAGFKLALFSTETGISMVTGELLPPDWLKQKSVCI